VGDPAHVVGRLIKDVGDVAPPGRAEEIFDTFGVVISVMSFPEVP
jgi:hypothetical protein